MSATSIMTPHPQWLHPAAQLRHRQWAEVAAIEAAWTVRGDHPHVARRHGVDADGDGRQRATRGILLKGRAAKKKPSIHGDAPRVHLDDIAGHCCQRFE